MTTTTFIDKQTVIQADWLNDVDAHTYDQETTAHQATKINFNLNETGSINRTVKDKLRDYVSVKDFGAVGDGVTDDTVAIQAAITTGKLVHAPQGQYKITAPITLVAGGGIIGEGEKTQFIRFFTGGQLIRHPGGTDVGTPIILRDFCITKDNSITVAAGDTGIDIGYSSQWSGRGDISNIVILYQWDGFKWKTGTMNSMQNIQVIECKGHGFYGINSRGELNGCLSQYNAGNGYFFFAQDTGETGVQLTSCGTFGNQGWGYLFDAASGVTGANIYMKGVSSSTDSGGRIGFIKRYDQIWMTQILIESAGQAHIPYPSFTQNLTAKGLYLIGGSEKIVGSDIFIQTCNGAGISLDSCVRATLSNIICIDNGHGKQGGGNVVGVNFNSNNVDCNINNLIANYGTYQTTDIAISQASNQVSLSNVNFRTYYQTGVNTKFNNVRTSASNSVASASTPTLPDYVDFILITGTTDIDAITASRNGRQVTLKFSGILTIADGNNLKLNGNYTTSADDTLTLICDGTNWYEVSRSAN